MRLPAILTGLWPALLSGFSLMHAKLIVMPIAAKPNARAVLSATPVRRSSCTSPIRPRATSRRPSTSWSRACNDGEVFQTLLGVTGSGKTFTMANVIARLGRPAIVFAPNKTLAAQLYSEFREFFPEQRGRVLRQLLRLLPARGLCAAARPVHREGLGDQRAHRADAPVVHQEHAGAARRGDRGHRVGHLRHWPARGLPPDGHDAARRATSWASAT